ncbi:phage capsid protein [Hypericibacter terrae]|uniref:Phage capsid protein n=1 Tax=Hypericibacter terrae TaxID=2602015 RepID=A0A5J6MPE9_9PROT|nr:phage major capsid protein [Hypericibacter terrae]QEX18505.1 phage capsid protein [Hypericibacter terrae]
MSDRLKALREKRGKIVKEMREILEAPEKEKRDATTEETQKHSTLFADQDKLRVQIEAEERQVELDREMASKAGETEAEKRAREAAAGGQGGGDTIEARQMKAYRKFLVGGLRSLNDEEQRSLNAGSNPDGGYTIAPPAWMATLIKNVDNAVIMRQRGTVLPALTKSESLGVPTLDADPDDADWTVELSTGNEDTAMKFGKRELAPNPMAKRIKISKKLLRISSLPIEQIVSDRLAYKFAVTQEKAYLTGDGVKKPLGVFTASNDGIPTGRDVSTGNDATQIKFDGLIEAKFAVKGQYWNKASWLFHRDGVKQITKLKDGEGQYIWRQSVREGEPDMLLGRPLDMSEYAPNTFTSGLYVGMFGDFSWYWIVDALDMQVQRLVELYAESNQDGIIGRYEGDGMPVLAEAFARVKLG